MDEDGRNKWEMTRDSPLPPTTGFITYDSEDESEETSISELLSM